MAHPNPIIEARELLAGHIAHKCPVHPRVAETILGLLAQPVPEGEGVKLVRRPAYQKMPGANCCHAAEMARRFLTDQAGLSPEDVANLATLVIAYHPHKRQRHEA